MSFDFGKVIAGGKRSSNETMLLNWLSENSRHTGAFEFSSVNLQTKLPHWFETMYGTLVTPDTLSRLWRKLREDYKEDRYNSALGRKGIKIEEFYKKDSKVKHYRVLRWTN